MSVQQAYIANLGGNKVVQFLFDDVTNTLVTASLVSGTNFMDLGEIADSKVVVTPSEEVFKSEDGLVKVTSNTFEGKISGTNMQRSKEIADWKLFTTRGNMKLITYKYDGYRNLKRIEVFAVTRNSNEMDWSTPGGATSDKFSATCIPPATAVTLTTTQIGTMRTAIGLSTFPYASAAVSIPVGQELVIIET